MIRVKRYISCLSVPHSFGVTGQVSSRPKRLRSARALPSGGCCVGESPAGRLQKRLSGSVLVHLAGGLQLGLGAFRYANFNHCQYSVDAPRGQTEYNPLPQECRHSAEQVSLLVRGGMLSVWGSVSAFRAVYWCIHCQGCFCS